jgi:hypothetical protein
MSKRDASPVPEASLDVHTRPIETSGVHQNRLDDLILAHPEVRSDLTPKYDQRSLVSDAYSARTITHAHTTNHSEKASVYSYRSSRDGNYLKELHGR